MAKQLIGIGASANDGTGDPLRTAFGKANNNFDELYAGLLAARGVGLVFAGPASGADAVPAFRVLAAADIPDISATYVTPTGTKTLTNKRITKRIAAVNYSASVTVNSDSADGANVGTLTGNIAVTIGGTPTDGQELLLRFRHDATGGRVIDLGANVQYSVDVPDADIPDGANEVFKLLLIWDATLGKWIASALNQIL